MSYDPDEQRGGMAFLPNLDMWTESLREPPTNQMNLGGITLFPCEKTESGLYLPKPHEPARYTAK